MLPKTLSYICVAVATLAATATAHALTPDHFSRRSLLSGGKWIKVKVCHSGMQAISFEQLREWGFDKPSNVAVYGFGNAELAGRTSFADDIPDDLTPTATLTTADRIIFYGEATTRLRATSHNTLEYIHNVYDNYGYYFLSDSGEGKPVRYIDYSPDEAGSVQTTHLCACIHQPDDHNPMSGGAFWLGPELSQDSSLEYSFDIKKFQASDETHSYGTMGYTFVAGDDSDTTTVNVVPPSGITISNIIKRHTLRTGSANTYFNSAGGSVRFRPLAADGIENQRITFGFRLHKKARKPRFAAIKNVWAIYPRRNELNSESQMQMSLAATTSGRNFSFTSTRKAEVWDISDPLDVYACRTKYNAAEDIYSGTLDRMYGPGHAVPQVVVFDPDGELYTPEYCCEVPPQNIHGDEAPDMVIISTDELYDAACELADIHRSFGSTVNVYTHNQVLNEFGSGGASPMAYKMMVKMFHDRAPQRFRNLLLYGPATWDFRSLVMPDNEYLLTFLADRESHYKECSANFSSDAYFGMVDDSYSNLTIELADQQVAVGRLNVANSGAAHDVNMKIHHYMSNPPDPAVFARLLAISCDGDANAHFYQGQDAADGTLAANPAFTATRAHVSLYPVVNGKAEFTTRKAMSALYEGQGIFDYTGHGDENNLGRGNAIVWQKASSATMNNRHYPVAMLSTCSAYNFDHGNNDIATSLTFKAGAGAIATIGACRKVYLAYNGIFNNAVLQSYAQSAPGATIGDMYTRARHKAVADCGINKDALANNMCYNLCGDPLTKLPVPDYNATITSIGNKQAPAPGTRLAAAPGSRITISGNISDKNGKSVKNFNGSIRAIIYDGPSERRQYSAAGTDTVRTISLEEEILAECAGRVKAGEFTIDMCLPEPRIAGIRNRIILSAISDGTTRYSALGFTDCFAIDPEGDCGTDVQTTKPVISRMYIDSPASGSNCELTTDSTHTFYAIVEAPGTGISNASAIIGGSPRLTLDGRRDYPGIGSNITIDSLGRYIFAMPLTSELTAGYHHLKFSLSNTLGEPASRSISFLITPAAYKVNISVAETTATECATIEIESEADGTTNRLLILDYTGHTVFSASDISFPYRWNLNDNNGNRVADGAYTATVMVADSKGSGASAPAQITVIRK